MMWIGTISLPIIVLMNGKWKMVVWSSWCALTDPIEEEEAINRILGD